MPVVAHCRHCFGDCGGGCLLPGGGGLCIHKPVPKRTLGEGWHCCGPGGSGAGSSGAPGWRAALTVLGRDLSQLSHELMGRHRTQAPILDTCWTMTCGYGLRRTGRTGGTDLRIRRLGVRVPPSAPSSGVNSPCGDLIPGRSKFSAVHQCEDTPTEVLAPVPGILRRTGCEFSAHLMSQFVMRIGIKPAADVEP
jgi:hypothetical protein